MNSIVVLAEKPRDARMSHMCVKIRPADVTRDDISVQFSLYFYLNLERCWLTFRRHSRLRRILAPYMLWRFQNVKDGNAGMTFRGHSESLTTVGYLSIELIQLFIIIIIIMRFISEKVYSYNYNTASWQKKQDAQLSQRDRAAGCVTVFAKSRRLELGDDILRTL